jgi:nitrate reductase gamma subunit
VRDQLLFAAAPYLAALTSASVCIVRFLQSRHEPAPFAAGGTRHVARVWRTAIGGVLLGHALAFAFPAKVLLLNREPFRMFALEGCGLLAGALALAALMASSLVRSRNVDGDGLPSPIDVVLGTLIFLEVSTGLAVAVLYRWASSWSEVTLEPYLVSLLRLEPSVVLVSGMPLLVRLHVFCAFVIVAVLPFTRLARFPFMALHGLTDWTIAPALSAGAPAWRAIEAWSSKNVQALRGASIRGDREEN